jgi:hypothetical protein
VLLCLGLCGNATVGLTSRSARLVIPRAHDCATILLGSRKRFKKHFERMPSQPYLSRGHVERSAVCDIRSLWTKDARTQKAEYAQRYGEDNAAAIFDVMNPHFAHGPGNKVVYIDIPQTGSDECLAAAKDKAEKDNATFVRLQGELYLIKNLMAGNWYPEDFLVVKQGMSIAGEYDWDSVMSSAAHGMPKSA